MPNLQEIADHLGLPCYGDTQVEILQPSSLKSASSGSICFIQYDKYLKNIAGCDASAFIVRQQYEQMDGKNYIVSHNPELCFVNVIQFLTADKPSRGVHRTAVIDQSVYIDKSHEIKANSVIEENVKLAHGVRIGANCSLGENVTIGKNTFIHDGVTIHNDCVIGENCIIHSGVVIGSDGFGLVKDGDKWLKIPQIGKVILHDRVEVGANTTIDRGALDDTIIESGVKMDNQIQVAHNVRIGENTAIAACVGIAGSANIGKNCQISGAAVILGHLSIVDNVTITAMSLVTKSIKNAGVYSSGTPLLPNKEWHKNNARYKSLDKIADTIQQIKKQNA